MTAQILNGNEIAQQIRCELKEEVKALTEKGIVPGLAVIIVGENPASKVYVGRKHKACQELGLYSEVIELPVETTTEILLDKVKVLNQNPAIHGILVQLPLPKHIEEDAVLKAILPEKDVDGFHPVNVGKLTVGQESLTPCTPTGIMKMLELKGISPSGKHAVIIGRSNIVGKPMAALLLAKDATVTICHSRTATLSQITRQADILVAAVGKPNFVTADMVKPGSVVIDVGINRVDGKLIGDVDFAAVKDVAGSITPVPGGVGPLTIAMLLYNTVKAAKCQNLC